MICVITVDGELESATRLGFDVDTEVPAVKDHEDNVVIRWGSSYPSYTKLDEDSDWVQQEYDRTINPSTAIKVNCNKEQAIQILNKAVITPAYWLHGNTVPAKQVVVHRHTRHTGGSGFKVEIGPFKVAEGCYATQWIPTDTEYRVWFCGDQTMCGIRTRRTPCEDKYPCRSMWGYTFKNKVPPKLHKETLKAAKAIGLECGAADILLYQGKYYFLELNSAATIDKQVIEDFYKTGLQRLIKQKFPDYKD